MLVRECCRLMFPVHMREFPVLLGELVWRGRHGTFCWTLELEFSLSERRGWLKPTSSLNLHLRLAHCDLKVTERGRPFANFLLNRRIEAQAHHRNLKRFCLLPWTESIMARWFFAAMTLFTVGTAAFVFYSEKNDKLVRFLMFSSHLIWIQEMRQRRLMYERNREQRKLEKQSPNQSDNPIIVTSEISEIERPQRAE